MKCRNCLKENVKLMHGKRLIWKHDWYECPDCNGGQIFQKADGSEFCLDCGWEN